MNTQTPGIPVLSLACAINLRTVAWCLLVPFLFINRVEAVEQGEFKAPSLDGCTMTSDDYVDGDGDGDGDGVKETRVRHYRNDRGDSQFSM